MDNATRKQFNAFLHQVAKVNGVDSAAVEFNIAPVIEQKMEKAIQESSDFLKMINVEGVDNESGETLGLVVSGSVAGRTDTSAGNRRDPKDPSNFKKNTYKCVFTTYDTSIRYGKLDSWAGHANFQLILANALIEQQALDRIKIGFNGTHIADQANLATYPMLEDVNVGWLQKVRERAPEQVMTEVAEASGQITIGVGGDYSSLHSLVRDLKSTLAPWHRKRKDLVVLLSSDMLDEKILNTMEKSAASNQEELAGDEIILKGRIGGLPPIDAPYFPDNTVVVTTLKNLSIYYQNKKRRRHVKDEPEYGRIADYQSSNEDYVVEDYELIAMAENIVPYVPAP